MILGRVAQQTLNRLEPMLARGRFRGVQPVRPLKKLAALANSPLESAIGQLGNVEHVGVRRILFHRPHIWHLGPVRNTPRPLAKLMRDNHDQRVAASSSSGPACRS